jgi:hypothetical protein
MKKENVGLNKVQFYGSLLLLHALGVGLGYLIYEESKSVSRVR